MREENNHDIQGSPGNDSQQNQQYMEMDLNVYEDDDDETLHRKLIAAKIARKRAEEDYKLLSNRISLLKQEEQKVMIPLDNSYVVFKYRLGRKLMKLRKELKKLCPSAREILRTNKPRWSVRDSRKCKRLRCKPRTEPTKSN